jgi:hypothetical protein
MQQRLQQRLSEEPKNVKPIVGKDLLLWRLKRLFWGRNSITTAILIYGLTWCGILTGIGYFLQMFHIDPGNDSQHLRIFCFSTIMFGTSSLLAAYATAKTSPKWSTFAVGLFTGGFLGYFVLGLQHGLISYNIIVSVLLLSNVGAFLLARKIRNKHFGIVKPKRNQG